MKRFTFSRETIDIIMNFLHDDPFTIRECGLVCRQWYWASAPHLFDVLECDWRDHEHADLDSDEYYCSVSLLHDRNARATSFIREMRLVNLDASWNDDMERKMSVVLSESPSFPKLGHLALCMNDTWQEVKPSTRNWLQRISANIFALTLDYFDFSNIEDFFGFISSMPLLRMIELDVSEVRADSSNPDFPDAIYQRYVPPRYLHDLSFGFRGVYENPTGCFLGFIIPEWISFHRPGPGEGIKRLRIHGITDQHYLLFDAIEHCVVVCSESLVRVVFEFSDYIPLRMSLSTVWNACFQNLIRH